MDDTAVAMASIHAMGSGTLADFQALYTVDAVNREAQTTGHPQYGAGRHVRHRPLVALRFQRPDLDGA